MRVRLCAGEERVGRKERKEGRTGAETGHRNRSYEAGRQTGHGNGFE